MIVKVDLSPEAKARLEKGQDFEIAGMWAIYYKHHIFDRWHKMTQQYADQNLAIKEARVIKDSTIWIR